MVCNNRNTNTKLHAEKSDENTLKMTASVIVKCKDLAQWTSTCILMIKKPCVTDTVCAQWKVNLVSTELLHWCDCDSAVVQQHAALAKVVLFSPLLCLTKLSVLEVFINRRVTCAHTTLQTRVSFRNCPDTSSPFHHPSGRRPTL